MDTYSGHSAKENMEYDNRLLASLQAGEVPEFVRFYTWKTPGITFTKGKELPQELHHLDASERATGGGIVFHAPGDLVFSIGLRHDSGKYPKGFKAKIQSVSEKIGRALEKVGVPTVSGGVKSTEKNLMFCNGYHNPYERTYNGQKVVAIAQRRFKDVLMMQGVIHVSSNVDVFQDIPDAYKAFLTRGINGSR